MAQSNVKLTVDGSQATRALGQVQRKTQALTGSVNTLRNAFLGIGAAAVVRQTVKQATSFEKLNVRLKLLTQASGTYAGSLDLVTEAQKKFNLSGTEALEGITNITARLAPLGVSLDDIKTTFFGFNTAALLAGASAQESSNAFRQLAQALGSGRLQGDEFRSLAEQVPTLLAPIAAELGTTVGGLKKFASEGKLTSAVVIRALKKIEKDGGNSLKKLIENDPTAVFKSLQNQTEELSIAVGNVLTPAALKGARALTKLIESATDLAESPLGKTIAIFSGIALALKGLATIIPIVTAGITLLKVQFASAASAAIIAANSNAFYAASNATVGISALKAAAAVNTLKIALIKTGVGALVVALGILVTHLIGASEETKKLNDEAKSFNDNLKGIGDEAKRTTVELEKEAIATKKLALAQAQSSKAVGNAKRGKQRLITELKDEIALMEKQLKITKGDQDRSTQLNKDKKFNEFITSNLKEQTVLKALLGGKTQEEIELQEKIRDIKENFETQDANELIRQLKKTESLKNQLKVMQDQNTAAEKLDKQFKKAGETITESLADGIKDVIKGTESLGEMLGNIANQVSDILLDIGIKAGLSAMGLPVPGFAAGGRPPVGKPAIVGERGPELFIPSQAGTIIPNNQLGGGSSTSVVVNVDASGSSVEGDAGQAEQLGSMLGAAVQAEIARQQRPGGLLAAR